MTLEEIATEARRLMAGKSHGERESAAMDLARAASGEDVQFVQCDRGTLTAWFPKAAQSDHRARLEENRRVVEESKRDRAGLALVAKEHEARIGYTAREQEQIWAAGHDPEILARCRGARNLTEFKRRKAGESVESSPTHTAILALKRAGEPVNKSTIERMRRELEGGTDAA